MSDTERRAEGLRAWAKGMTTLVGAAELLIRCGPPLLTGPWVEYDDGRDRYWFNTETAADSGGWLSGGERRVLDIATSLVDDEKPVALGDAIAGLDRKHLALVLAAIAHAAGSHEHTIPIFGTGGDGDQPRITGFDQPGSLFPWPEEAPIAESRTAP